MIQVKDAIKSYEMGSSVIHALDGINFSVSKGEFVSLVGPSGSGKSTLMNVIGALDSLDSGHIVIDGKNISKYSDSEKATYRREMVGFVFQTFNLQRHMTALENVELPLIFAGVSSKSRRARALTALDRVGLVHRVGHRPTELSGGEQQRVAIARAVVNLPQILIADEPTGNLDSHSGESVMKLLRELNNDEGVTVVIVTHDIDHAQYADKVFHMLDGKITDIKKATK